MTRRAALSPAAVLSALVLAAGLVAAAPAPAQAAYIGFPDVPETDWYVTDGYLDYVEDHDLISGYADGTFGPAQPVTRAEAVTILWRMAGEPASQGAPVSFPDCDYSEASFYADAVTWACSEGVVSGYENGLFGPADPVTREQLAKMLASYAGEVAGLEVSSDGEALSGMGDAAAVSDFALEAVSWAADEGILTGDLSTGAPLIMPQRTAQRAHAAKMLTVFHRDVVAPTVEARVACGDGLGTTVLSAAEGGESYLFLPSNADLSAVELSFPDWFGEVRVSLDGSDRLSSVVGGGTLDLSALPVGIDGSRVLRYGTSAHATEQSLTIMVSSSVSSLYLTSEDPQNEGRHFVEASPDHSAKAKGSMTLVTSEGGIVYDGELTQIKGRGNSTWQADKKPYQIKLDKKCDLLQTGNEDNENKTWVLLAEAIDVTLAHNSVAFEIASALGLEGTPECEPVDLYYDGEYRGTYLLSEKVEVNDGRVDIHKLEDDIEEANEGVDVEELPVAQTTNRYGFSVQYVEGVADPADISGGYLIELDNAYYQGERCWFETSEGYFVVKEPENLSQAQMLYVSELMQEAIDSCSAEGANPATGLPCSDYLDVDSLVRAHLINEFSKNVDWMSSSTYFYLPSASDEGMRHVFYAGPVWDFDSAFGVRVNDPSMNSSVGYYFSGEREPWFMASPIVSQRFEEVLDDELLPVLREFLSEDSDALKTFGDIENQLVGTQRMNQVLWGLTSYSDWIEPAPTYAGNMDYLEGWLRARTSWLEGQAR